MKRLVLEAREQGRPVVAENLKFDKDRLAGGRKWNRIRSNFIWRRFLDLLERKCREYGVEFLERCHRTPQALVRCPAGRFR